jgi:predicted anti-sigma-YlaC factor YlaD
VSCELTQRALSARLDGEEAEISVEAVEAHLSTCGDCRHFAAGVTTLHRRVRVRPAEPVPDLADRILLAADAAAGPAGPAEPRAVRDRPALIEWSRYALVWVALVQLIVAIPGLVLGEDRGASIHIAHELGAWDVALAVAWLAVAWRPSRATGLLPFVGPLALVLVSTAVLDLFHGRIPALTEAHHLLDLAGVGCTWYLARHRVGDSWVTPPWLGRARHA